MTLLVCLCCRLINWEEEARERQDEGKRGGSMNNLIEAIDKETGSAAGQ